MTSCIWLTYQVENINIMKLQAISTKARSLSSLQGPAQLVDPLFFIFLSTTKILGNKKNKNASVHPVSCE